MMRVLFLIGILSLGMKFVDSENIHWLIPTTTIQVESSVKILRVSIKATTNLTMVEVTEHFLEVEKLIKTYKVLGFLTVGSGLREKYINALSPGENYVSLSLPLFRHLYSFFDTTKDKKTLSNCSLEYELLNVQAIQEGLKFLHEKQSPLQVYLDEATVKADPSKLAALDTFVLAFNTICYQWYENIRLTLAELDILESLHFPESLRGRLETVHCFPVNGVEHENIKIMYIEPGKRGLNAELELSIPATTKDMEKLIPISYGGVQLRGPESHNDNIFYAQTAGTNNIQLLNCTSQMEWSSEHTPICHDIPLNEDCLGGLQQYDTERVMKSCSFTSTFFLDIVRIKNDGILVQSPDFTVIEGGKTLYNQPPFVIFTNQELKISNKQQEFVFPANLNSEKREIITSKLSKIQVLELKAKAHWQDFTHSFNMLEHIDWMAIGIEGLLTPLVFLGICLGLRRRVVQRRSELKLQKQRRKNNQRETRALLRESRL